MERGHTVSKQAGTDSTEYSARSALPIQPREHEARSGRHDTGKFKDALRMGIFNVLCVDGYPQVGGLSRNDRTYTRVCHFRPRAFQAKALADMHV